MTDAAFVETLVAQHRKFLSFLEHRVGNRAVAEDILQAAFVRSVEHADEIRDGESAVAWFYRLLRNALVDYYRRQDAERRALERAAGDDDTFDEPLHEAICECFHALIPTLKPEYADVLRKVDLDERAPTEVGSELGLTPAATRVRLHRARQALREQLKMSCGTCATHACLDCACGGSNPTVTAQH